MRIPTSSLVGVLIFLVLFLFCGTAQAAISYSNGTISISDQSATTTDLYNDAVADGYTSTFSKTGSTSTLTANISIGAGSNLSISDEKIIINCESDCQYGIINNGNLSVESSNITTSNANSHSYISSYIANYESRSWIMNINNSTLSNLGSNSLSKYALEFGQSKSDPINIPAGPSGIKNSTMYNCEYGFVITNEFGALPDGYKKIENNTFHDLTYLVGGNHGLVTISNGTDVLNNKFYNINCDSNIIWSSGYVNNTISGNEIYNSSASTNEIISSKHSYNVTISDNYIHDCTGVGIIVDKGWYGTETGDNVFNNTIENITVPTSAAVVIEHYPNSPNNVHNNYINNVTGQGLIVLGMKDSIFENNTILNCTSNALNIGNHTYRETNMVPENLTFRNNTIKDCLRGYYISSEVPVMNSTSQDEKISSCTTDLYLYRDFLFGFFNSFNSGVYTFANGGQYRNYKYLDVQCVDVHGQPIENSELAINNTVSSLYPAKYINGGNVTSETTGADGHTALPSDPSNSLSLLDYVTNSTGTTQMSYSISATSSTKTGSVTGISPSTTWYRSNRNVPENTVKIMLSDESDTGSDVAGFIGVKNYNFVRVNSTLTLDNIDPAVLSELTLSILDSSADPTDGLIAKYNFDTATNGVVVDSSGNGNNATVHTAVTLVDGKHNSAYAFSSATSAVDVSIPGETAQSVAVWVNRSVIDGFSRYVFDSRGCGDTEYFYAKANSAGYTSQKGTVTIDTISNTTLSNGTNHLIVITGLDMNLSDVQVGSSNVYSGLERWGAGYIDGIAFYDRNLTQSEINALYYDPVSELQFKTNSNETYSGYWNSTFDNPITLSFGASDSAITSLSTEIPTTATVGGTVIRELTKTAAYNATVSARYLENVTVYEDNVSALSHIFSMIVSPSRDYDYGLINYSVGNELFNSASHVSSSVSSNCEAVASYNIESDTLDIETGVLSSGSGAFALVESEYLDPIANFSASPSTGNVSSVTAFTDSSQNADSWAWDFDNDGDIDSTLQTPSYSYTSGGTYTVNLTVSNDYGSDSEIKTDYITVEAEHSPVTVAEWFWYIISHRWW